nr:hypothetical protein [Kibdelosporangium sp. MJ126-NF4]CTQ90815.1 hypothetical protein [Kibdelosporangium sp. MJ126-NF4]
MEERKAWCPHRSKVAEWALADDSFGIGQRRIPDTVPTSQLIN